MENKTQSLVIPETFKIGNNELNKATLIAKKEEDTKLVIVGINDTAGYKKAIALRAAYRTQRTTLEKVRKDLSKPHQDYLKSLKKAIDELGAIAEGAEIYFDNMIKDVDNEKARIKAEKEAEQQRIIQQRISQLYALGARFDGESYTFDYSHGLGISSDLLARWDESSYTTFLNDVQESYEKEQQRLEKERLDREQAEAELEAAKAKLLEKQISLRKRELFMIGMKYDEERQVYWYDGSEGSIGIYALSSIKDENWERLIFDWTIHIRNYTLPLSTERDYPLTKDGCYPASDDTLENELDQLMNTMHNQRHKDVVEQLKEYDDCQGVPSGRVDTSFDSGRVDITVTFFNDKPYYEFELSNKLTLRIYPYHYEEQAVSDISNIVKSGNIQDKLYYTVLKK